MAASIVAKSRIKVACGEDSRPGSRTDVHCGERITLPNGKQPSQKQLFEDLKDSAVSVGEMQNKVGGCLRHLLEIEAVTAA
jgi:hypothetical protein